jgi:hypothetical protein|tara:strand:- start:799 stop:951 length:153 start_codon:yes stop_codon:yes gene_type:complete
MKEEFKLSSRATCHALDLSRIAYGHQPDREKYLPVIEALFKLAEDNPTDV